MGGICRSLHKLSCKLYDKVATSFARLQNYLNKDKILDGVAGNSLSVDSKYRPQ